MVPSLCSSCGIYMASDKKGTAAFRNGRCCNKCGLYSRAAHQKDTTHKHGPCCDRKLPEASNASPARVDQKEVKVSGAEIVDLASNAGSDSDGHATQDAAPSGSETENVAGADTGCAKEVEIRGAEVGALALDAGSESAGRAMEDATPNGSEQENVAGEDTGCAKEAEACGADVGTLASNAGSDSTGRAMEDAARSESEQENVVGADTGCVKEAEARGAEAGTPASEADSDSAGRATEDAAPSGSETEHAPAMTGTDTDRVAISSADLAAALGVEWGENEPADDVGADDEYYRFLADVRAVEIVVDQGFLERDDLKSQRDKIEDWSLDLTGDDLTIESKRGVLARLARKISDMIRKIQPSVAPSDSRAKENQSFDDYFGADDEDARFFTDVHAIETVVDKGFLDRDGLISQRDKVEDWILNLVGDDSVIESKREVLARLARKISDMTKKIQPSATPSDSSAMEVASNDMHTSEIEKKLKTLNRKLEFAKAVSDQLHVNKSQLAVMSPEEVLVNRALKKVRLDIHIARKSIDAAERKWHWYALVSRPNDFHGMITNQTRDEHLIAHLQDKVSRLRDVVKAPIEGLEALITKNPDMDEDERKLAFVAMAAASAAKEARLKNAGGLSGDLRYSEDMLETVQKRANEHLALRAAMEKRRTHIDELVAQESLLVKRNADFIERMEAPKRAEEKVCQLRDQVRRWEDALRERGARKRNYDDVATSPTSSSMGLTQEQRARIAANRASALERRAKLQKTSESDAAAATARAAVACAGGS